MSTAALTSRSPGAGGAPVRTGPFWHEICGLPVCSDVRLHVTEVSGTGPLTPAWEVRLVGPTMRMPLELAPGGAPVGGRGGYPAGAFTAHRDAQGVWWWWNGVGTFHVSPDARLIEVCPESAADERSLSLVLTGPLAAFVMYRLGHPTLHGSAVATPRGAAVFLGQAGYGKSTLAAAFVRRGMALLADDLLPLGSRDGRVDVRPSLPQMKLWPTSVEHVLGLETHGLPKVSAHLEKKLIALERGANVAREAVPLRSIYVLDRYVPAAMGENPVEIRRLSGREGLAAILAQLPAGSVLQPAEVTRFLPLFARMLAQAPLRVLRYPGDFAALDMVCARILDDQEDR